MRQTGIDPIEQPPRDCAHCRRLVAFRRDNRAQYAEYFNAPVPSFGDPAARLLIVGLAPGLHGANRTGRPFTGDHAGELLYATLLKFGFVRGFYRATADDGLALVDCRITNAVRCVPPQNKPLGEEARACRRFLATELAVSPPRIILALGRIAHEAVLAALGQRRRAAPFVHGATHALAGGLVLADSYHCSRYNTNTRRLTPEMFEAVFAGLRALLDDASAVQA